jgi:hypothetical protein
MTDLCGILGRGRTCTTTYATTIKLDSLCQVLKGVERGIANGVNTSRARFDAPALPARRQLQ